MPSRAGYVHGMTDRRLCWRVLAALLLVLGPATVACGAGQVTQTAEHVTPRAGARIGEISVLDVEFLFRPPVAGDEVYRAGELAPLAVTIVNHGASADRLVRVSSPIATSGIVVAEGLRIPGGQTLTAGQEEPLASIEVSYENDAGLIALAGLLEPIRSGRIYPVIFEFERAGTVFVGVPVQTPDIPRQDLIEGEERPWFTVDTGSLPAPSRPR